MRTDPPPDLAPDLAGRRILVGISGSIAAVKMPLVVSALVQQGAEVRCVLTASAAALVSPVALASLSRHRCYLDADQWSHQAARPLHVELAEWAELVLLAPLSATSLGRWVHGLADTLLASTLLATEAPVLAAAAMNTSMWEAGPVQRNWQQLQSFPRVLPLAPAPGLLACDRQRVFGIEPPLPLAYIIDTTGGAEARDLVAKLRNEGLFVERAYGDRSMKSQFKTADRSGARFALVIGDREVADGTITIRDLRGGGDQRVVAREALLTSLLELAATNQEGQP